MRCLAALAVLAAFATPALAQQNDPWEQKDTPFGRAAVGYTRIAANEQGTVLAVGLYCGRKQPFMYLYGLTDDRMASGKPVVATVTVDGLPIEFKLSHVNDAVATMVPPGFS